MDDYNTENQDMNDLNVESPKSPDEQLLEPTVGWEKKLTEIFHRRTIARGESKRRSELAGGRRAEFAGGREVAVGREVARGRRQRGREGEVAGKSVVAEIGSSQNRREARRRWRMGARKIAGLLGLREGLTAVDFNSGEESESDSKVVVVLRPLLLNPDHGVLSFDYVVFGLVGKSPAVYTLFGASFLCAAQRKKFISPCLSAMFLISSAQATVPEKLIPIIRPFSRVSFSNVTVFYANLLAQCVSSKCLPAAKSVHAELIKNGNRRETFLCNCLTDAYFRLGEASDAFQSFHEIPVKNIHSWNILLGGCFKSGCPGTAREVFSEMPERDVVSWNTMVSGLSSSGLGEDAWALFLGMEVHGFKPNGFTYSIILSSLSSISRGKLIHGRIIRSGLIFSNIVVGNSLIDLYGKLGLPDYAFNVFLTMSKWDTVSWNSMIAACGKSVSSDCAVDLFCAMRASGFSPDPFTFSTVFTSCSGLQELETGKQVFAHCVKVGFVSNSIVSSAIIDMFANCNRLDDSVQVFEDMSNWNSATCSSMISSYARHGFHEEAGRLFVLALRMNIQPTEFAVGSVLNSMANLTLVDQGTQIHCLLIKLGFEQYTVMSSLLMDMYTKYGLIEDAINVFSDTTTKDIVLWNTLILGFARNGKELEALKLFEELVQSNLQPDRITLAGLLLACGHAGYVEDGWEVFLSMEEKYNVIPGYEHYTYVVEMFSRAGKLTEAMEIIESMPQGVTASIWYVLLGACRTHGNDRLAEKVAGQMIGLEPHNPLPYLVLIRMYAIRGMWEGAARVRQVMKDRGVKKVVGCSWIGVKNQIVVFKSNQIMYTRGEDIHDMLKLLAWEMQIEGYFPQEFLVVGDGGDD
ncbi:hypothetical protein H6P81_001707 [Aristolochia fimbriata]|uniref:Pentatricopeptide repeat-containing protein n=1 Tax=Aristolochia fimbriata TaxID=158543 RepID=A0AAV7F8C6_ARIFI|nr:hypothetical protein H6P81_001707 [Aristolochia fimbriata]